MKHYFKHSKYYIENGNKQYFSGWGYFDNIGGPFLGVLFGLGIALWISYPLYKNIIIPKITQTSWSDYFKMLIFILPALIIIIIFILVYHCLFNILSDKLKSDKKAKMICEILDVLGLLAIIIFGIFNKHLL